MYFIKLANAMRASESMPGSFDMLQGDLSEAAPGMAGLGVLGGLATYGGLQGKRNIESDLIKKLEWDVRAAELADKISMNARARELLDNNGVGAGLKTEINLAKDRLRPQNVIRRVRAGGSKSLLDLLRSAQRSKIL